MMNLTNALFDDFDEVLDRVCTKEQQIEIDMRVKFMKELMQLRDSKKISQEEFNVLVEGDDTIEDIDDMLDFIFHMLAPLGKTISIIDKELAN